MSAPTLLWTGGWDSTFRLLQTLLVEGRPVRPAYFVDPARDGTAYELRAMESIRSGLLARLEHPRLLAPTQMFVPTHFPATAQQEDAYRSIAARTRIGSQYLWLAAAARTLEWTGVEMCMVRNDGGPAGLGHAIFTSDGQLRGADEQELFHSWAFPVRHLSKRDMGTIAREHGFYDLLVQRWFCHTPLLGRPCGTCRPCQLTNKDGVEFANPLLARGRLMWRGRHRGMRELVRRAAGHPS